MIISLSKMRHQELSDTSSSLSSFFLKPVCDFRTFFIIISVLLDEVLSGCLRNREPFCVLKNPLERNEK